MRLCEKSRVPVAGTTQSLKTLGKSDGARNLGGVVLSAAAIVALSCAAIVGLLYFNTVWGWP